MPLRMRVHDREPIGLALRRFKKLLERSGIQKELRKRKYYEKPCEARRRAELRKQRAILKARTAPPLMPRSIDDWLAWSLFLAMCREPEIQETVLLALLPPTTPGPTPVSCGWPRPDPRGCRSG